MPHCYLLAVCSGSSLDAQSNNFSLFNLVEQVHLAAATSPGIALPLEVHAWFALGPGEADRSYEIRWVIEGEGGVEVIGPEQLLPSQSPHFRARMFGLGIPARHGDCRVRVEWRTSPSGDWTRDPAAWPLTVDLDNDGGNGG